MATATADIVIVNWNSGGQLRDCITSIARDGEARAARVIVVDNGSTDGSDEVSAVGLDLEIIRANANLGFGRACNLGAARGQAPYILFLNPDAELGPGALDGALDHLADHAETAVLGVRLTDRGGTAHRHVARHPTWRSFVGNSLGLTRIARKWFPPIPLVEFDHLSSRAVEHVMGAFYLIRRELFERIGGFDEAFFVYLEDLDLSRRVRLAGGAIDYRADLQVYHRQGGTSEKVRAHRLFYALQSNVIFAAKHLSAPAAGAVIGITLLLEPASRLARAMLRMSPTEFAFTAQGYAMLLRDLPRILRVAKHARQAGAELRER